MKSSKRYLLTSLAAAFAALMACGQGENAVRTTPPPAPPAPAVTVVNGAGRADICRALAARLGADVKTTFSERRVAEGRLDYGLATTSILADPANLARANEIRDKLGVGAVTAQAGLKDIQVVVGWDAAAEPPAGAPTDGVLVSKAEKAVFFYRGGKLANVWPCAIGKPASPTPAGTYEVTVTLAKPTWYWQGKAIPPGPDNGLGDWFIGINKKGYGLHGTNEPESIGTAASHGCIRMYNEDAGALVALVHAGTPVVITE